MTARQYAVIEDLLDKAEDVTVHHPLLTSKGRDIQVKIRQLLHEVAQERIRAEERERDASQAPS